MVDRFKVVEEPSDGILDHVFSRREVRRVWSVAGGGVIDHAPHPMTTCAGFTGGLMTTGARPRPRHPVLLRQ
jgi:hypothetical protein